jgi:hypothetical protein
LRSVLSSASNSGLVSFAAAFVGDEDISHGGHRRRRIAAAGRIRGIGVFYGGR